jgi:predicted HTH transcriptional regulator
MTREQFLEIVAVLQEGRNLEFKQSTPWTTKEWKAKIAKTVLGFSNVRDGGNIVIGVEKNPNGIFELKGMEEEHFASYDEDHVASVVATYADPYAKLAVHKLIVDEKRFVVIRTQEFDEVPVICKQDFQGVLRKGAIYTRSHRIAETVEVPTQTEMREIIELATDKETRKFIERMRRVGALNFPVAPPATNVDDQFDQQLLDLE